jgi:hypothetical protein|tara:strand:+ start:2764 stop:3738 length:975 start_codon:yes stop_codon:yes gene_type:complete
MNWLGCLKIYDAKRKVICEPIDISTEKMYEDFVKRIGHTPKYNVWYDTKNPKIFSADDTYINSQIPNEASFLDSRNNFLSNEKYGLQSLSKFSRHLSTKQQINVDPDGFYQALPGLEKYKDSTILVVGGGPSTSYCDWENEERDFTWSCNHFYKNDKLLECKVDMFYVNAETHMGIAELSAYIKKHDTICAIDTSISRPEFLVQSFMDENCKTMFFNLRLFLTSGAAPKMVALASLLGAKQVKVVGMDGWTAEQIENLHAGPHAFEKDKKLKISANYTFDFQRRETVVFWDYYLNFQENNVIFKNIGETYPHNMSSEITKKLSD